MTKPDDPVIFGAEAIRHAAHMVDSMPEAFLNMFDSDELVRLWHAYFVSSYDVLPHEWSTDYLFAALAERQPSDLDPRTWMFPSKVVIR